MATPEPGDKVLAAAAYILTILTGLIVLVLAKDRYAKWNALQAIGLGVVLIVLNAFLGLLGAGYALGGAGFGTFLGIGGVVGLLVLILVLVMAWKAYEGQPIRLPVIAEFADKNA